MPRLHVTDTHSIWQQPNPWLPYPAPGLQITLQIFGSGLPVQLAFVGNVQNWSVHRAYRAAWEQLLQANLPNPAARASKRNSFGVDVALIGAPPAAQASVDGAASAAHRAPRVGAPRAVAEGRVHRPEALKVALCADWSSRLGGREVYCVEFTERRISRRTPPPRGWTVASVIDEARGLTPSGATLLGFDAPIGVPHRYLARAQQRSGSAGANFWEWLPHAMADGDFFAPCTQPDAWRVETPFFRV